MIPRYMNLQCLLSVTNLVTLLIVTLVLEGGWEVLGLHMVPDSPPPMVGELPTDVTHPLAANWGLHTEPQQVRGGLAGWQFMSLG